MSLVIASFFILACTGKINEKVENDLTKDKILGNVKILSEYRYLAVEKFGETEKGKLQLRTISKYDKKGYLTESIRFKSDGSSSKDENKYTYASNGDQIEKRHYSSDGKLLYKDIYKYDKDGNMLVTDHYYNDDLSYKDVFEYDISGNQIAKSHYFPDGRLNSKDKFKYDEAGNQIESIRYNSDGSFDHKVIQKYDNRGNLIEKIIDDPENPRYQGSKDTFMYNDKNLLLETNGFGADGRLVVKHEFKYYSFDNVGNYQKLVYYDDNKPKVIIERQLEYY